MKNVKQRILFLTGLAMTLLFAAWRVYGRRSRQRVMSAEGLDDPDVARAFKRVATLPPMRLMRWHVVRRATAMQRSGQVADLGCGPGHLVVELARVSRELQVVGIDLSEEMLAQAEHHARRAGLEERITFRTGDALQIPFSEASLDLVVSTLSLHHWSDPVRVLNEIARVLRPGGSFLVFDLRRDLAAPWYLLIWFVTRCVVPGALRRAREPLGSRDAAYTPQEAADLAGVSRLTGWHVTRGPLWLIIEGTLDGEA
jgi:ubiquinone/menaquinone biosynthesis C-methylase UbiE